MESKGAHVMHKMENKGAHVMIDAVHHSAMQCSTVQYMRYNAAKSDTPHSHALISQLREQVGHGTLQPRIIATPQRGAPQQPNGHALRWRAGRRDNMSQRGAESAGAGRTWPTQPLHTLSVRTQ